MAITYGPDGVPIDPKEKKQRRPFSRIYKLGKEKLSAINGMIAKGESSLLIARVIQSDWKEMTDLSEDSIRRQLDRYRGDAPIFTNALAVAQDEDTKKEILDTVSGTLNVVRELEELIRLEKKRILATVAREEKVGLPFQWLTRDIGLMKDLLRSLADLQFDLGIHQRHVPVREIGGSINLVTDTNVQSAMRDLRNDELVQTQLAAASSRIIELLGKDIEEMLDEPDGEY